MSATSTDLARSWLTQIPPGLEFYLSSTPTDAVTAREQIDEVVKEVRGALHDSRLGRITVMVLYDQRGSR